MRSIATVTVIDVPGFLKLGSFVGFVSTLMREFSLKLVSTVIGQIIVMSIYFPTSILRDSKNPLTANLELQ